MVQCEMCGTETASPKSVMVEGAELAVCTSCASFGTQIESDQPSSTSTKYSTGGTTSSTESTSGDRAGNRQDSGSTGGGADRRVRRTDMFDRIDTLASDYPERIRNAREGMGASQEDLAKELNEKASVIRKLERGDIQPSDDLQRKLERELDISLTASEEGEETDWDGGGSPGEFTLGDVVTRRDS